MHSSIISGSNSDSQLIQIKEAGRTLGKVRKLHRSAYDPFSLLAHGRRHTWPLARIVNLQIKKNPIVASAMTKAPIQPTRSIGRGSVSRPMMWGFIAITIITAMSGAASTPLTTALQ